MGASRLLRISCSSSPRTPVGSPPLSVTRAPPSDTCPNHSAFPRVLSIVLSSPMEHHRSTRIMERDDDYIWKDDGDYTHHSSSSSLSSGLDSNPRSQRSSKEGKRRLWRQQESPNAFYAPVIIEPSVDTRKI